MSVLTPEAYLAVGGALGEHIPRFESRPQQMEMAATIVEALEAKQHAIVEAPTGVGKSLAYLVPVCQFILRERKRVVISTNTIALQEQLVGHDIPLVAHCFPGLEAVLVKGRQNYLCRRRLDYCLHGQRSLFDSTDETAELRRITEWADRAESGDKSELGFAPDPAVWHRVRSDQHQCRGRKCIHYEACFFYHARQAMQEADILVVNHHLYFSDLALREESGAILPAHEVVVFDEAHTLEDIATDHLGLGVTDAQIRYFLDDLFNERGHGLLGDTDAGARGAVANLRMLNQQFWYEVATLGIDSRESAFRIHHQDRFANPLSPAFDRLVEELQLSAERAEDDNARTEFKAHAARALEFAGTLRAIIEQQLEDYVYYANVPTGRGSPGLSANPLAVAPLLAELLFAKLQTVVLTSATLAADDSERFLFLRRRLGLEESISRKLDSPFDFERQARLLINRSPLDPNGEEFERRLAQWLGDYLEDAKGGAFILFTSYRQLRAVHELLRPRLERANRFVLQQGDRIERTQMLELFKSTGDAVLFGTASFWEGVDVRGEALQHVIICKLPFEMPAHPLVEARHQAIRSRGGNPFMERTVPEAILRLKQGTGRLIRTQDDTGTIVICDHRVMTKAYGRYFVRALPSMPTEFFEL